MSGLNKNWRWERVGCRVYTDQMHRGRHVKVADISIAGLDETDLEARGHLIAAAPDLLEALVGLVDRDLTYDGCCIIIPAKNHGNAIRLISVAREAIARATEARP